jgi:hypothetical protein
MGIRSFCDWLFKTNTNHVIAIATVVAAGAAVFYTCSSNKQLRTMQDTLGEMERSGAATIEASRNDQRAWVGAIDAVPPFRDNQGQPEYLREKRDIRIAIRVINSGRSPATKLDPIIRARTRPVGEPFTPDFGTASAEHSIGVLQPGAAPVWLTSNALQLNEEQIRRIRNRTDLLEVFGSIVYYDVFDRQHTTTFCMYLAPPEFRLFNACAQYNEAN